MCMHLKNLKKWVLVVCKQSFLCFNRGSFHVSPSIKNFVYRLLVCALLVGQGCVFGTFEDLSGGISIENLCNERLFLSKKQIGFEQFPDAHNPSILKIDEGIVLVFRYIPDLEMKPHISYIGVTLLNDDLEPITEPKLLYTRPILSQTPSQSEDARLFRYKDRIYLTYNDNIEDICPLPGYKRRDIFIAELTFRPETRQFKLLSPVKLCYEQRLSFQLWEKNWVPFEYNKMLFFSYMLNPHEAIYCNPTDGTCFACHQTEKDIDWNYGKLRGSSAAELVDGEYLGFFHSGTVTSTACSYGYNLWHYFMGAYTFSPILPLSSQKFPATQLSRRGSTPPLIITSG